MDEKPWSKWRASIYSIFMRNPASNRMIVSVASPEPSDVALDIGCGPGAAVRAAAPLVREAVGVDPSLPMVEIAVRRSAGMGNVRFEAGAAERLPLDDDAFTIAWTIQAFHHWADREAGFREVARVLRPGGRFFIIERETTGAHGLSRSDADAVSQQLRDQGFVNTAVDRQRKELIVSASLPFEAQP